MTENRNATSPSLDVSQVLLGFTAPKRAATLAELILAWAQRDSLYARRRRIMSEDEVATIRLTRMREVHLLPNKAEHRLGFLRVKTWYPPQHGQG